MQLRETAERSAVETSDAARPRRNGPGFSIKLSAHVRKRTWEARREMNVTVNSSLGSQEPEGYGAGKSPAVGNRVFEHVGQSSVTVQSLVVLKQTDLTLCSERKVK